MKNSKLTFILIAAISLMIMSCQDPRTQQSAFFNEKIVLKSNKRVAAYAIPNIISTPNGTVLCFTTARIGNNHDWGNIQEVVVIRSLDNGNSWGKPEVIASIENWTVRQTSAIVDPQNGKIMVFGHKSPRFTSDGERISETWKIAHPDEMKRLGDENFYVESFDDGVSWSEMKAVDLPYWPHDPGIVLQYGKHKGRYILPARTIKGEKLDWNNMFNGVLFSDDKGMTWQAGGLTQSHVGEACIVELSDGRIYINSRNHADNYGIRNHAISSDGGIIFTEFGDDPQLIEPTCDAGLTRYSGIKDGNIVLFSNPAVKATKRWDGASRRRMTVKASFDDCKTWPLNKLVYAGLSAYSGITVGKDGIIFLAYERAGLGDNDSRENIAIARFNMAWLEQEEISPPLIEPEKIVFYEDQEVKISSQNNSEIHYTIDGTVPDKNSPLLKGPLILDESTIVRAIACSGSIESIISISRFVKSKMKPPQYTISYSEKYPASGELALVDGIKGSLNYHDGCWQGFEGNDMEIIIDLPTIEESQEIAVSFLQAIDYWIFFPEYLSFLISNDGKNFKEIKTIKNTQSQQNKDESIQTFEIKIDDSNMRYLKVLAKNIGACPDWHKGAGGKSWLFVDEIIIE